MKLLQKGDNGFYFKCINEINAVKFKEKMYKCMEIVFVNCIPLQLNFYKTNFVNCFAEFNYLENIKFQLINKSDEKNNKQF